MLSGLHAGVADANQGPAARPDTSPVHRIGARVVSAEARLAGSIDSDDIESSDIESGQTADAAAGTYIERVSWIPDPAGERLAVYPTDHGRYEAPAAQWPEAWDEVVRMEPGADYPHMRDQFRCHVEFARIAEPDKPSWNLELYRPDVGYLGTVLASCNPD
ncbi:DUF2599 domain-containing protein [Phytoactinopolyspora halotolerans]|uniref:DUF2599 domain-containing protein n=2 Tax=Phytoactinopolyspora halotolerans TaxID=1981512 RepID=A0A6L9S4Q5_9ACTN|nr:DUF2599 domain-containing protein [Phytoactinopolyspora halotolerans]